MIHNKKIYIIGGPTASGKSELALMLAHQKNGIIVNADSMQIYADLTVLSARPDSTQMQGIPHFLYGYLDAWSHGNVMDWLHKAVSVLQENPVCIVVGGTGMYLDALINGINEIPDVDPNIRNIVRQMPIKDVKAQVKECLATDDQRLRRALEVQLTTGKTLSFFQKQPRKKFINADFDITLIMPPREILYERCNSRFLKMLEQGAQEEVQKLIRLNSTGGVLKAIGVHEIISYFENKITYDQMIAMAQQATRQYAKRQTTWFRHHLNNARVLQSTTQMSEYSL